MGRTLPFKGLALLLRRGQWVRIGPDVYVGLVEVEGHKKARLRVLAPDHLVIARDVLLAPAEDVS